MSPEFGDVGPALDAMLLFALRDLYDANWPEEEKTVEVTALGNVAASTQNRVGEPVGTKYSMARLEDEWK
jgi:hypothetical protein